MDRLVDYLIDIFVEYKDIWTRAKAGSLTGFYINQRGMAVQQHRLDNSFVPNDTYKQVRKLEQGHEGVCVLSKSKTTSKLVVIKYVRCRKYHVPTEAKILLDRLRPHPNVVEIFATRRSPLKYRTSAIFMEYCNGGDLLEQLSKFQDLRISSPNVFTLHLFASLACALAYIHHGIRCETASPYLESRHHEPIIHGDLKPDNVFLLWRPGCEYGLPEIVLGDCGLAELECNSWGICGTIQYESPESRAVSVLRDIPSAFEKASNAKIMTTRSDMYGLGLMIYLMATSKHWKCGRDPQAMQLPQA